MPRNLGQDLETSGNEAGEESTTLAWPESTQKKQTCLSQIKPSPSTQIKPETRQARLGPCGHATYVCLPPLCAVAMH